jgi:hypothetical protein
MSDDSKGWKPTGGALALMIIGAAILAAITCWLTGIGPLPTTGHWSKDPGWLLTFAVIYFFVLYLVIERVRRRR